MCHHLVLAMVRGASWNCSVYYCVKFFQGIFFSVVFDFREEDKNIFDYCRENNIEHVSKAISSKKVDVNTRDEEVGFFLYIKIENGYFNL